MLEVEWIHGDDNSLNSDRRFRRYRPISFCLSEVNLFIQILHRPIQIQGKSRIDTWLPLPLRRAHSEEKVIGKTL